MKNAQEQKGILPFEKFRDSSRLITFSTFLSASVRLCVLFFLFSAAIFAQQNPVSWQLTSDAKGKTLKKGESFKAVLTAAMEDEWYIYAPEQPPGGPIPTTIKVAENRPFQISGNIQAPKPETKFDQTFKLETKTFSKQVDFVLPLMPTDEASADEIAIDVRFQTCNNELCLPPKTIRVSFAGAEEVKRSGQLSVTGGQTPSLENPISNENSVQNPAYETQNPNELPLSSFIWLAITLGALSLLTPCVFPMIPITVSYFTNHSGRTRGNAVKLASIYSLGIIATFTLLGMLLAIFVGAAGINLFAANPWVNLLITGIFLFFAFNLFGAYEINVPTGILTRLDNLTRSQEGEGSGIIGALLMGLTFTLTSFTCTSPFVGTILVSASQGSWQMPLLGMLAFSAVFALPFFALALMPQLASQLPRAGGWMNSIKVSMGFLEVAAAMKFLSNVDLIWKWGIFTRPVVLAIWIAIGVILSLYLLGKFQLPHDTKPERIGALRLTSAIVSLAISFYLLTGLFGARLGELESFLPPDLENSSTRTFGTGREELKWIYNDYEKALTQAKAENKRVFIDFTGYTCTNCRWMEANVFVKKEVEAEMSKFVLAKLFTDGEGEIYERQQQFQEQTYKTVALPFYAIVEPDGRTISTFPGLTRNVREFVDFLQKAQEN